MINKETVKFLLFWLFILIFTNSYAQLNQQPTRLTGDWNGSRTTILNKGISIDAIYTGEIVNNLQGGISDGSEYVQIIDLIFDIKSDNLINLENANFYIDLLGIHGKNPSNYIGDIQGVSNIAATKSYKIFELWVQQNFCKDKLSFLFGVYDLNSEFDVMKSAGLFLNSSFGMGAELAQSGKNGPSTFPYTSLAFRFKMQFADHFCIQAAILDGVPENFDNLQSTRYQINSQDGALLASEIILTSDTEQDDSYKWFSKRKKINYKKRKFRCRRGLRRSNRPKRQNKNNYSHRQQWRQNIISEHTFSKIAIGGWCYTSDFQMINQNFNSNAHIQRQNNWGLYGLIEKNITYKNSNRKKIFGAFFRCGISNKNINQIDKYFGSGIVFSGFFCNDQIGIALAAAHNNDKFRQELLKTGLRTDRWEMALEFSYRVEVKDWFSIQPNMQYIMNPGFNSDLRNSIIAGARLEICL